MSIIQGNSKTSAAGYTIDQSIRFDKTTSSHLSKTYGSAGNRRTWTFSTWFKRGKIDGSRQVLFAATGQAYLQLGPDAASREMITILNEGTGVDLNWYTTAVYRDPSAWYHLVWQFDSTQATADNRTKLYINGVQVTDFTKAATPDLNLEGAINNNVEHKLGEGHIANFYYDGYQAEIYFIDGQALDATSFGEVNADTGQWVPIAYTGSYGTNGFYITGENSADLGADYSGNSNNFTSSGLTSADQMLDTPTDNYATLNPLLKHSSVTFADGNLEVSSSANGWFGSIGTVGIQLGDKVYFEGKCLTNTRLYFGLSRVNGSGGTIKPESDGGFEGGQSDTDYMWRVTSADTVYYQTTNQSVTVSAVSVNDIVGCSVDTDGTVKFYKNGTEIHSFSTTLIAGDTYMPVYSVNGATSTEKWEVRFGSTGISHQPAGFSLLRTSDMDDPTIADPTDHFQTVLDTGANIKTTAEALYTDQFEWIKDRANANNHQLIDSVRGTSAVLQSNTTAAETTYSAPSGNSVGWVWKANGAGSSNTDGDVTSTVSANTTAGFSIVTYTPGTGVHTWGHGLGVAPSMVIVKDRGEATNWLVYHASLGPTQKIILNLTNATATDSGIWNNTAPTSSVVTTGSGLNDNHSFVAYCFAEVEGFSKFGKYTGNGSSDGPFVYCGFRPSWVMFKRTDSTADWLIKDASGRDPYNVMTNRIYPNTTAGDDPNTTNNLIDFTSNGFKHRAGIGTGNYAMNASGSTYIYAAFAESPFQYANAR